MGSGRPGGFQQIHATPIFMGPPSLLGPHIDWFDEDEDDEYEDDDDDDEDDD